MVATTPVPSIQRDGRPPDPRPGSKPLLEGRRPTVALAALWVFIVGPFLALLAAVPVAWGWGLSWLDVTIAVTGYLITGLGISVGFHRYLTHRSFKATRWLRLALTVAGTLALEGEPTRWVADHRRHHAFSDRDGDPHSPWRYGESVRGVAKGLLYAHCGWFFEGGLTNRQRFAPDLLADQDIRRIDRMVVPLSVASLLAPAVAGGLLTWSWQGALTAFFWGGLVRMALAHHVTCSINSVCHVVGDRPFQTRNGDRAANFWPLALLSFGESWHNSHHADPTCARLGVLHGQIDPAARLIWLFERLGWVHAVRWPDAGRLAGRRMPALTTTRTGPRSAGSSPKRPSPGVGDQDPAGAPPASASSGLAVIGFSSDALERVAIPEAEEQHHGEPVLRRGQGVPVRGVDPTALHASPRRCWSPPAPARPPWRRGSK